ncbi:homeobox protein ceh-20-like [Mytilus trossulus]|uniref:homeobox protein ceh-20-like n=1 Tax=Mytilus trossulus TaxID=6551 RepID=UPI003004B858
MAYVTPYLRNSLLRQIIIPLSTTNPDQSLYYYLSIIIIMADFLDFLLSSPTKSPLPIEITSTTTLEDIIAATIQPDTTISDATIQPDTTTSDVTTQPESPTTDPTTISEDDDEALAATILEEATALEPETETRLADSLFDLLGSPPPEQLLTNNSAVLELQSLLKTELKQQTIPQTLMSLLHKPKTSVFTREQQLQRQFTKLEVSNPTQVSQLSSFFKYQSAVIETERYQSLHQNATKPHLRLSINDHFDEQLHKAIDRVELSVMNLQQSVTDQTSTHTTTKMPSTRPYNVRSRPQLSRRSIQLMEEWYHCNIDHPYPDSTIIQSFAQQGNIKEEQVKKWFANKRSRTHNTHSRTAITSRKMSSRYNRNSHYQPY